MGEENLNQQSLSSSYVEEQTETESDDNDKVMANRSVQENAEPWYLENKYSRYWKHQKAMSVWFEKYREVQLKVQSKKQKHFVEWYSSMKDYHTSMAQWMQYLGSYYSQWCQTWFMSQANQMHQVTSTHIPNQFSKLSMMNQPLNTTLSSPNKRLRNMNRLSSKKKRKKQTSISDMDTETDYQGDHFQMEFTQEMIDFYSQSAKHKNERDTKNKELQKADNEIHVNLGEASMGKNKASVLPPSERPGARRTTEMRELYGKGAAMIHGMETAMQLNYDRNCDRQQPKLWPQLPLKIHFPTLKK